MGHYGETLTALYQIYRSDQRPPKMQMKEEKPFNLVKKLINKLIFDREPFFVVQDMFQDYLRTYVTKYSIER